MYGNVLRRENEYNNGLIRPCLNTLQKWFDLNSKRCGVWNSPGPRFLQDIVPKWDIWCTRRATRTVAGLDETHRYIHIEITGVSMTITNRSQNFWHQTLNFTPYPWSDLTLQSPSEHQGDIIVCGSAAFQWTENIPRNCNYRIAKSWSRTAAKAKTTKQNLKCIGNSGKYCVF